MTTITGFDQLQRIVQLLDSGSPIHTGITIAIDQYGNTQHIPHHNNINVIRYIAKLLLSPNVVTGGVSEGGIVLRADQLEYARQYVQRGRTTLASSMTNAAGIFSGVATTVMQPSQQLLTQAHTNGIHALYITRDGYAKRVTAVPGNHQHHIAWNSFISYLNGTTATPLDQEWQYYKSTQGQPVRFGGQYKHANGTVESMNSQTLDGSIRSAASQLFQVNGNVNGLNSTTRGVAANIDANQLLAMPGQVAQQNMVKQQIMLNSARSGDPVVQIAPDANTLVNYTVKQFDQSQLQPHTLVAIQTVLDKVTGRSIFHWIALVVFVVAVGLSFYFSQRWLLGDRVPILSGIHSGKSQYEASGDTIPLVSPVNGANFSLSFWFYVNTWEYNYGIPKTLFRQGGFTVYLDEKINTLTVIMPTTKNSSGTMSAVMTVPSIPLKFWNNVVIVLKSTRLDVWFNGGIIGSTNLVAISPTNTTTSMFINPDGGFDGQLASVYYFAYPVDAAAVARVFDAGPVSTSPLVWLSDTNMMTDIATIKKT